MVSPIMMLSFSLRVRTSIRHLLGGFRSRFGLGQEELDGIAALIQNRLLGEALLGIDKDWGLEVGTHLRGIPWNDNERVDVERFGGVDGQLRELVGPKTHVVIGHDGSRIHENEGEVSGVGGLKPLDVGAAGLVEQGKAAEFLKANDRPGKS